MAGGTIYGDPFVVTTAEYHVGLGHHFLTVNFPGHDATAAYEDFDGFTPALDAAFDAVALYANGSRSRQARSLRPMRFQRSKPSRSPAHRMTSPVTSLRWSNDCAIGTQPDGAR
jgi:hypothetical protein